MLYSSPRPKTAVIVRWIFSHVSDKPTLFCAHNTVSRQETVIGSSIQSGTLAPDISRPRGSKFMSAALCDIDELFLSVECDGGKPRIWTPGFEDWRAWGRFFPLLHSVVHLHNLWPCCREWQQRKECSGQSRYHVCNCVIELLAFSVVRNQRD